MPSRQDVNWEDHMEIWCNLNTYLYNMYHIWIGRNMNHDKPCNMGTLFWDQPKWVRWGPSPEIYSTQGPRKNFCRDGRYMLFFHGFRCFHVFHQFWIPATEQQRWKRTHRQGILIKTDIGIDALQLSCRRIRVPRVKTVHWMVVECYDVADSWCPAWLFLIVVQISPKTHLETIKMGCER